MDKPLFSIKVSELAAQIYTDLVGSNAIISASGVAMTTDASNLAKLSFKLAAVFQQVEDELNAESLPKNQDFKVNVSDIASWTK